MERVEDVLDLKLCTDGVQSAMQEENYEQVCCLGLRIRRSVVFLLAIA